MEQILPPCRPRADRDAKCVPGAPAPAPHGRPLPPSRRRSRQRPLHALLSSTTASSLAREYREVAIDPVLNKVEAFLAFPHVRNILGQGRSTLSLDQAMARGRIVIVNLAKSEIGETAAHLHRCIPDRPGVEQVHPRPRAGLPPAH